MTRQVLADHALSSRMKATSFTLRDNPFAGEIIHPGPYRIGKKIEDVNTYRVGHPLAQRVLGNAKAAATPTLELVFDLTGSGKNFAILKPLVGKQGWLRCVRLSVTALEAEDHLVLCGLCGWRRRAGRCAVQPVLRPFGRHG